MAHCQPSLKISSKSVQKFLRKVANRQTNRHPNNDDYTAALAEVNIVESKLARVFIILRLCCYTAYIDDAGCYHPAAQALSHSHTRCSITESPPTSLTVTSVVTSASVPSHNESARHAGTSAVLSADNSVREQV